ncbi:MAG: hypothetical protein K1X56_04100 [Flavobacteriales bacterium]|nr:hypothetical protein [Flavobacteriales bacterium]
MEKKKSIISYEKLSPEMQQELKKKYPAGYAGHVQKIVTPKETLTVVTLETAEAIYLVKVKFVEKKSKSVDDEDEEFFGDDDFSVPDTGGGFEGDKGEFGADDDDEEEYDKPDADGGDDDEAGDDAGDDDDED